MGETTNEKSQKTPFFKGMKAEFKRIIWPDRQSLVKETTAVVIVSVILGVLITLVDFAVKYGIGFLVK